MSIGLLHRMQAIFGTLMAWPPLSLTDPGSLKLPSLPEDQLIVLIILLVLLCIASSITLALRTRWMRRTTEALSLDNLQPESPNSGKVQRSTKLETHIDPNHLDESPKTTLKPALVLAMLTFLIALFGSIFSGPVQFILAIQDGYRAIERSSGQPSDSTSLQEVFQVYQPVPSASEELVGCDLDILLMEHVFSQSYGKPFVGAYEPPNCTFDAVQINLTMTSRGRQYDRLGLLFLGDTEVFRTSTAEPTSTGIVWTYIKEMSQYSSMWQQPQRLIFDLGNLITDVYTGSFNATLTAHFSYEKKARTANYIFPISARKSASNSSSAFTVPSENAAVTYTIPAAASRAVVSISACGQSQEEFWWSNVFSEDTGDFTHTVGELYGYSPFREIQLYIDGNLAGFVWPFPIIFNGGVAPGFWRPIVGTDAFDLRQPEIDISPFLPLLQDGREHSFEIRVTGLNISEDGSATLANTVGAYWVVTGNIFLYVDGSDASEPLAPRKGIMPQVEAPAPKFIVTRNIVQNRTGGNDPLSYSVEAERTFSVTSSNYAWSQRLSFSNHGLLNQQGYSQVNKQLTTGHATITEFGDNLSSNDTTFKYPLLVNATYGITSNSTTIDAWMERGLEIESSGGPGISTYTLVSGPSRLKTHQSGQARYTAIKGGNSRSFGSTADEFHSTANDVPYSRSVKAVNGVVVYDNNPTNKAALSNFNGLDGLGRDSVRSMLGRGPGLT